VENGGGYSANDMLITLPVKIPEGKFAMGFLYNEKTKILEGMPLTAESATSITVATRHFSSFVISIIDKFKLKKDIDTSFRPGIDDWQFINYGSFIAPEGHCAGQSVSAMWYYYNQPDGKDLTLYGRYDNNGKSPATPGLWLDDSRGYRLASMVQEDMDWDSWASQLFANQRGVDDELAWDCFAYSMQFLKQPQYVGLDSDDGGHAIICYRIKDGNLYVADPNYPGNTERRIEYKSSKFTPYESGANKAAIDAGKSISYTKIGYVAQSSRVDWNKMNQRWTEFKNGTIGNGKFPNYRVVYQDEKGQYKDLKDGYISATKLIKIDISSNFGKAFAVYREGKDLTFDASGNYELKPGNNLLGICVYGTVDTKPKYVDFQYINVIYNGLSIEPRNLKGDVNKDYTFTAKIEIPMEKARCDWYINDKLFQSGSGTALTTKFAAEGAYTIIARYFDKDGKEISSASVIANIGKIASPTPLQNNMAILQKTTHARFSVTMEVTENNSNYKAGTHTSNTRVSTIAAPYGVLDNGNIPITWSGLSFTGKSDYMVGKSSQRTHEISGTASADGKTLNVKYSYQRKDIEGTVYQYSETVGFELSNVPLNVLISSAGGETTGVTIGKSVNKFEFHSTSSNEGKPWSDIKYLNPVATDKSAITVALW
jgi:hypothetical protein